MTWDDWSDLEVTVKICEVYGINFEIIQGVVICSVKHKGDNVISISGSVDYCNNPADMWPIIIKHGICLTSPTKGRKSVNWSASWNEDGGKWSSGDIAFGDKNPLRAAAIVFLMIKGVKPDERI